MAAYDISATLDIVAGPSAAAIRVRLAAKATLPTQYGQTALLGISPKVASVLATVSGSMRVTFDQPMALSATLIEPANWSIAPTDGGAPARVTKISPQPGTATPIWLDFTTTEHTNGSAYDVWCNGIVGFPLSSVGVPTTAVASRTGYTGIGEPPIIAQVVAIGQNRVDIVFGEVMVQNSALATAARYLFDNGLTVLSVAATTATTVSLITDDQTPNVLYSLSLSSPTGIQDAARNEIDAGATGQMIGWTEPAVERDAQPLRMYDFIIEDIRNEEYKTGTLILKRLMEGPQQVWNQTHQSILDLSTLASPVEIRSDLLVYLKRSVGLTPDMDKITNRLDEATLRRLIGVASNMWKWRGNEDTLTGMVQLLVGTQSWICNWFHYRWIVEETGLGNLIYNDPWITPEADEDLYNLRIVDRPSGSVDRQLVGDLAKLLKPGNETVEITYLLFLERFLVDGDSSQWEAIGDATIEVADNVATITGEPTASPANVVLCDVADSSAWDSYVVTAKIKCVEGYAVLYFGYQDADNYAAVAIVPSTELLVSPPGTPGEIFVSDTIETATTSLAADATRQVDLEDWNGVRVSLVKLTPEYWEASVYFNNELIVDSILYDRTYDGRIGFGTSGVCQIGFVEVIEFTGPIDEAGGDDLGDDLPMDLGGG